MASIKDVAKQAGVSISTVSNVINDTKYVSEELKLKINQVIKELNYEVDPVARSLKSKKTMAIGVIITNINRIFFPQVIKGIQDAATKNGYNITFCNTDDSFQTERKLIQMLESNWLDGIILDSVADSEEYEYFKHLSNLGNNKKRIPIVSLERRMDSYGIASVVVNNRQGGSLATKHLMDCGCKKIVHITGPLGSCLVQDRLLGYKEALLSEGLTVDANLIVEGFFSPLSGYETMKQILMSGVIFDGVFAANDQMAIGAIKAIKEQGLRVPEDVKIIGFDNTFVASIIDPSLTTVNVPKYKLGTVSVDMLIHLIEQGINEPECIELPINLVVRQSTDIRGDKNWDLYGW
ncbi:MAG: LacI family DNA-binding transcriptional regulator [Vallitaleaceae bacterium]|nr:LacI family DNA-binding transcriptional regulator [Vallitaleaceae bacterium]